MDETREKQVWIAGGVFGAGRVVPESEAVISPLDHGITVGDGVFETVKAAGGEPFALTRHLTRLARSAAGLGLPAPDLDGIAAGVRAALAAEPGHDPARVRITVTAGPAPLGSERGEGPPTCLVAVAALAPPAPTCDVAVVPWTRNEHGALAGLKTTSYAENVVALSYARQRGADEAVFANTAGGLCEGTGSNIFAVLDGELCTPPLSAGPLDGITRRLVLEWWGGRERDLPIAELRRAPEAFRTSTGCDVQPIRAVDGTVLAEAPGPVTRKVQEVFAARAATDSDP